MAIYRTVSLSFWTDSKVDDDFTPEDKYFMLYLLTNPHTKISGCYEIGIKQFERETGYNSDTIERLIKRMEDVHNVIRYCKETKEVLILNWNKYNWCGNSSKLLLAVHKEAEKIKCVDFKDYILNKIQTPDYKYPDKKKSSETSVSATASETVTASVTETETDVSIGYGYPIEKTDSTKVNADFDRLWNIYPKKKGKKTAFTAYERAIKKGVSNDVIEKAIYAFIADCKRNNTADRYIPYGGTWFNQERWNDSYDSAGIAVENYDGGENILDELGDF